MFLSVKKLLLLAIAPFLVLCGCSPPPAEAKKVLQPATQEAWNTDGVDISRLNKDRKLIALTFDDAPTAKLATLLDVFLCFNKAHPDCPASATIFCNGGGLTNRQKESLYTAYAMGMELGNHAFSHRNLTTLSKAEITEEIDSVDELLKEIDGQKAHLFRAPYGSISEEVINAVKAPIVDWYIDTEDWKIPSPTYIVGQVLDRMQEGAIVLMHDGYDQTIDGVKLLLDVLEKEGYQAVSVSQMAKAHGCTLLTGKVYTRARKQ